MVKQMSQKSAAEILNESIEKVGKGFEEFKKDHNDRLSAIEKKLDDREEMEARQNGIRKTSAEPGPVSTTDTWIDPKTKEPVLVLDHKDSFAALKPNKTGVSFGRWMQGIVTGKHADASVQKEFAEEQKALATTPDASGGYTVPEALQREFIDALRANLVLSRAGARFVPMSTKTLAMVRLLSDAAVGWHGENAADAASGDPNLGILTLDAKTIWGIVKFSLELSQDTINIQELLTRTLTQGVAGAIDRAGLGGAASNAPSGIMSFGERNRIVSGNYANYDVFVDAMGSLLVQNVPLERIGNPIISPSVWTTLGKLKTGITNDNTPLTRPPALGNRDFLVTNNVGTTTGSPTNGVSYLADWADLLYGVRQDIQVRVLQEAFLGSNLQVAMLVYARVDFAAARQKSFVTIEI